MIHPGRAKKLCMEIYPTAFRKQAKVLLLDSLPDDVSELIHSKRDSKDMTVTMDKMNSLLGYGQTEIKDRALDIASKLPDLHYIYLKPEYSDLKIVLDSMMDKQVALVVANCSPLLVCICGKEDILRDEEVAEVVLRRRGGCLFFLPSSIKANRRLVKIAAQQGYSSIRFAAEEVQNDRSFIEQILQLDGRALEYIPRHFRIDKELCLLACKQDFRAIYYVDESLERDPDILNANEHFPTLLQFRNRAIQVQISTTAPTAPQ